MRSTRSVLGRLLTATAVIASSVLVGLPGTASAGPNEGSISGTVRDHLGQPMPDVCVDVEGFGGVMTDGFGEYLIIDIPIGSHQVRYTDCSGDPEHLTQWYEGRTSQGEADWVDVLDQQNTALSDVYMEQGVRVAGNVTDSGGTPLADIAVLLLPVGPDRWSWDPRTHSQVVTDAAGNYTTGAVAPGEYNVLFRQNQDPPTYAEEWYDNEYFEHDASGLYLNPGLVTGVDAQLAEATSISGTVTDPGGNPLADICVNVALGQPVQNVGYTQTQPDGTYQVQGLPPGDLYVYFHDCNGPETYIDEWWNDQPNSDTAYPVNLAPGDSAGGIDATLQTGATISGHVSDLAGNPIPNVDVSFDDGGPGHGWAQTDAAGNYTSSPLPPGQYRVEFRPQGAHANEYWDDQVTWDTANTVQVNAGGSVTGIDAQLAAAARITGTVTDPGGNPVGNACVGAVLGEGNDPEWVMGTQTDAAGNYVLDHLPAGNYRVYFDDCGNSGPFLEQFWDSTPSFDDAAIISLAAGQTRANIDAEFVRASQIAGTVTDEGGQPLEGICVQAVTEDFTGGMDRTESDGTYEIDMVTGGAYMVQFADCGDEESGGGGTYLAEWYGGDIEPGSATPVNVPNQGRVDGIDAQLALAGGTGTVEGRVTNVRGEGLRACIALYMPTEAVRFMPTQPDGSFRFEDVPTGTWTLGFLGCGDDDVEPAIPDSGGTGVFFAAAWLGGALLSVGGDAPDPVAQRGTFITVHPNDEITADMCFGCESIEVGPPEVGDDYIVVTFDSTGLSELPPEMIGARSTLDYNVSCSSKSGTATSATQQGPSNAKAFQVKVSGFTPGAPYVCAARILSNGVEVANARTFEVTVGQATPSDPSDPTDPGTGTEDPTGGAGTDPSPVDGTGRGSDGAGGTGAAPRSLAFTGATVAFLVAVALAMVLSGAAVVVTTMRAGGAQLRRRATS